MISLKGLRAASERYPDARGAVATWHRTAKKAAWQSLQEVRRSYPHADFVEPYTVFNIRGNRYRLIVTINYVTQRVFIKHFLTRAEYDRGDWKRP